MISPQNIYTKLKNVDLCYSNVKKHYEVFKPIFDNRFKTSIEKLGNRVDLLYDII
jgi:hypothetical protein